jgi:hypothetical protein
MKSKKELAAWLYDRRLRGFNEKNMQKCEDEAADIIAFLMYDFDNDNISYNKYSGPRGF